MTYRGKDRRDEEPGRRSTDAETCVFHNSMEEIVKNTVSWKVFAAVVSAITVISLAYIGWADNQHGKAYKKAEEAIERTHKNRESLVELKVTQRAVLRNLEKLMRYQNIKPEITSEDVEKEISNGKEN